MKMTFAGTAVVLTALTFGAAPTLAGHADGHGKPGYGMSKGMMHHGKHWGHRAYRPTYGHGNSYGKGYGKSHWGKRHGGHHRSWAKGPTGHCGHQASMMHGYGHGHHGGKAAGYGYQKPAAPMPKPYATPKQMSPKSAPAPANKPAKTTPPAAPKNIVETAVAADQFATLVSAVQAADLVETLSGEGPFTVFAPTDDAFGKLPEGTVPGLLNNTDALTKVLTYHVVAGRLDAADLVEQGEFETLNGAKIKLGQLRVAKADIGTTNGVIHVIDEVLLPPES